MTELLKDGIYLNLDAKTYFSQKRMGSTDWKELFLQAEGWWFKSEHNPFYEAPDNKAYLMGHAAHAILLEGMDAYESRYVVEPDKRQYPNVVLTISDMHEALVKEGCEAVVKKSWKKADYVQAMNELLPSYTAWESIMDEFKSALTDEVEAISAETDYSMRIMHQVAMDDPDICQVLGHYNMDFPVLAEVSYLWTDKDGVRRRCRFDKIVPSDTMDLKTISNWQRKDLDYATGSTILFDGYSTQVADQHMSRKHMYERIRNEGESIIHGGTKEQRLWLQAMAMANKPFGWVWLWYQKPDRKAGLAPIIMPVREPWGGPCHRQGLRELAKAKDVYHRNVDKFGLDKPWSRIEKVKTTVQNRDDSIMLPDDKHFILVPCENEEEELRR